MDAARSIVASGPSSPQVIWAGQQESGRGRRGRHWVSPPGNLYTTVALPVEVDVKSVAQMSFTAAVSMAEAIEATVPALEGKIRLKWPNDVLVDGAKTVGLLLELTPDSKWLLIGSGVNIATSPTDMPYPVTRLHLWDNAMNPARLLEAYLDRLERWRLRWRTEAFEPVRNAWLESAAGLGETVTVNLPKGQKVGVFTDLDHDGSLILKEAGGRTVRIDAGDVILSRGEG